MGRVSIIRAQQVSGILVNHPLLIFVSETMIMMPAGNAQGRTRRVTTRLGIRQVISVDPDRITYQHDQSDVTKLFERDTNVTLLEPYY